MNLLENALESTDSFLHHKFRPYREYRNYHYCSGKWEPFNVIIGAFKEWYRLMTIDDHDNWWFWMMINDYHDHDDMGYWNSGYWKTN